MRQMKQQPAVDGVRYATSPRYKIMVAAGGVLSALLAWEIWRSGLTTGADGLSWGFYFFLAITLGVTLWYLREMLSTVLLAASGLTVMRPFGRTQHVRYGQMVSVSDAGRLGGRTITVLFHPLGNDGLVDLSGADSLIVPEVDDHDGLLAALEAHVPA